MKLEGLQEAFLQGGHSWYLQGYTMLLSPVRWNFLKIPVFDQNINNELGNQFLKAPINLKASDTKYVVVVYMH